jgi:hypothetical protein
MPRAAATDRVVFGVEEHRGYSHLTVIRIHEGAFRIPVPARRLIAGAATF